MTKLSPHLWYTDKADEAAAFYASKVEAGKHIGRLMSGRVLITVTGNPRTVDCVVCHAMAFSCNHDCRDIRPETEGCRAQPNAQVQRRASYHHCGVAASVDRLSAATIR